MITSPSWAGPVGRFQQRVLFLDCLHCLVNRFVFHLYRWRVDAHLAIVAQVDRRLQRNGEVQDQRFDLDIVERAGGKGFYLGLVDRFPVEILGELFDSLAA